MSSRWPRLVAAALCGLLAALACLSSATLADVAEDEVDLSLSLGGRSFTNDVGMTFVPVRKGTFLMGSPNDEKDHQPDEPQHKVEITRDFYLGTTEVTQKQYQAVMGKNPGAFSKTGGSSGSVQGIDTSDFPVETVSFQDAVAFLDKLNARDRRRSGWKYALPTEAQWEFACRGGGPEASVKPIRFADPPTPSLSSRPTSTANPTTAARPAKSSTAPPGWPPTNRTTSACTTCTATSGNIAATGTPPTRECGHLRRRDE